jgi:protein phosphatase
MTVSASVYACSNVGRTREHNEDAYLVADLSADTPLEFDPPDSGRAAARDVVAGDRGMLFMVADGLGGAAAGEVASQMAVRVVFDELRARLPDGPEATGFATALRDATLAANGAIHDYAARHPEFRGTGTTCTAAGLLGDRLFLAQVGDSRAYLVRDGVAQQITKDQSLVQKLVEAGEITPEQAETSARRNIILQALGPEPTVKVDLTYQQLRSGDTLVLCSDGLSAQVRADEISAEVAADPDLAHVCERLIARANETGGPDNITVVAVRFGGEALAPSSNGDHVGHRAFPLGTPTPTQPVRPIQPVVPPPPPAPRPVATPSGGPAVAIRGGAEAAAPLAGATPEQIAARRDRARVYYVIIAVVAVLVAAVFVWRWVSGDAPPPVPPATTPPTPR